MIVVGSSYDVFVSYDWHDRAIVEAVARDLQDRGLTVFMDRWYLTPGRPWRQALEDALRASRCAAVFIGSSQGGKMGQWQIREADVALSRQAADPGFAVIPVLLPGADAPLGFLGMNTWIDMTGAPAAVDGLAAAIKGRPPGPEPAPAIADVAPYRGLRAFREEDARFFFGREAFTDTLVDAVASSRFVAVVGASGSGKSSVVRAGLGPRLRHDRRVVWDIVDMLPGARPFHSLAAALVSLLEADISEVDRLVEVGKLARHLEAGDVSLGDVAARALARRPGTDRLLLLVDQWEELYALNEADTERRFVDCILEGDGNPALSVVATLRGDFFGAALSYRPLADRLQGRVVNLSTMTPAELRAAIVKPAEAVGLRFQEGLVDRIMHDLGEEPGSLPLLEFVLRELWHLRRDGVLSHASYEAVDGVRGAMSARADATIEALPQDEQRMAQRVFLQLVQPVEDAPDTRRRMAIDELGEGATALLQQLTDSRLLVTGRDSESGRVTVEVAHEALIRHWGRLRAWVAADRELLLWRQRLAVSLDSWQRTGEDMGALLRGVQLDEAERWAAERGDSLSGRERDFIARSTAARDAERAAHRRMRRRVLVSLGAGLVVALALATFASVQWQRANEQRAHAEDLRDQSAAQIMLASDALDDLIGPASPPGIPEFTQLSILRSAAGLLADFAAKYDGADSTEPARALPGPEAQDPAAAATFLVESLAGIFPVIGMPADVECTAAWSALGEAYVHLIVALEPSTSTGVLQEATGTLSPSPAVEAVLEDIVARILRSPERAMEGYRAAFAAYERELAACQ